MDFLTDGADMRVDLDLKRHAANFEEPVKARRQVLSNSVQQVISGCVEGDIAEFGVAKGHSLYTIATTMAYCDETATRVKMPLKVLHAFDSFQGLPEATLSGDIDAPLVEAGIWGPGKCATSGLDVVIQIGLQYLPPERFAVHPGWFKDTLPLVPASKRFALVHLDCDLYESSIQVLDNLFNHNRLADGCIILFDDFLCNRGAKDLGQRKAWEECKSRYKPDYTDLGFYGLSSWRCIVHTRR